jgi:hypothetical protein
VWDDGSGGRLEPDCESDFAPLAAAGFGVQVVVLNTAAGVGKIELSEAQFDSGKQDMAGADPILDGDPEDRGRQWCTEVKDLIPSRRCRFFNDRRRPAGWIRRIGRIESELAVRVRGAPVRMWKAIGADNVNIQIVNPSLVAPTERASKSHRKWF